MIIKNANKWNNFDFPVDTKGAFVIWLKKDNESDMEVYEYLLNKILSCPVQDRSTRQDYINIIEKKDYILNNVIVGKRIIYIVKKDNKNYAIYRNSLFVLSDSTLFSLLITIRNYKKIGNNTDALHKVVLI